MKHFLRISQKTFAIGFILLSILGFSSKSSAQTGAAVNSKDESNKHSSDSTSPSISNPNVDPKSRAYSIRKRSWIVLRYLRTTLLNFGRKNEWDALISEYSKVESTFQRGEWDSASTSFQALKGKLDQIAEAQSKDVLAKSDMLEKELQPKIVDLKIDKDAEGRQYVPVMEKHLQIFRDTWLAGKGERESGNQGQGLYFAKQGLLHLYKAKILLEKTKEGKLEPEAKLSKNRVLETDYLSSDEVKYWDDCLELLTESEEIHRKKEKEAIRKIYQQRRGSLPPEAKQDDAPGVKTTSGTESGRK
ncbi:hypothetical protein LEP1GSC050_3382 [Leptospira broomii serovar Hurstbridge str. 5399]|uniref:Uncharacterized protein n=1 Tax=Leptospira broomii serovar Hurstbridge str. 5399 TaxID=1049789 RepID=T0FAD3_9LEPT|nr:hypothetical protein LEP1GSC050_3382 [Leptospira broomii serovar Hurstbridge str. 5399]